MLNIVDRRNWRPFVSKAPINGTLLAKQVVKFLERQVGRLIHMEMIQFLTNKNSQLAGKLAYAVLSGVCGALILVAFLLVFLNAFQVMRAIPFIMAFNTAMTGYAVIDKCRERLQRKYLWALGAGLVTVVISSGLLMTLCVYLIGENLLGVKMFFLLLIVGAVCSELGALLAARYLKIQ